MPLLPAGMPGSETGYPPGDVGAVGFVFGAKGFAEGGFFVEDDEQVGGQPGENCVGEEVSVTEKQSLPEDQ